MLQETSAPVIFDPGAEMHSPELYVPAEIARGVQGFAAVEEAQIEQYRELGYLVIEEAFTPDEVEAAQQGLADLIAGRCPEFSYFMFEGAVRDNLSELTEEQRANAIRKLMHFVQFEPRLNALAQHPALIALVTRLLGETPEMFQDMALLKPPRLGREKPWHQDHAYFKYPLGTRIVGVWIALDEANLENGCMQVLAGAHRDGPFPHFHRRDWQICDTQMLGRHSVAVPLKPGGCLLFDGLLPHGTPHNHTPLRRRAVQFHYKSARIAATSEEERLALFGGEGRNASC